MVGVLSTRQTSSRVNACADTASKPGAAPQAAGQASGHALFAAHAASSAARFRARCASNSVSAPAARAPRRSTSCEDSCDSVMGGQIRDQRSAESCHQRGSATSDSSRRGTTLRDNADVATPNAHVAGLQRSISSTTVAWADRRAYAAAQTASNHCAHSWEASQPQPADVSANKYRKRYPQRPLFRRVLRERASAACSSLLRRGGLTHRAAVLLHGHEAARQQRLKQLRVEGGAQKRSGGCDVGRSHRRQARAQPRVRASPL